jgi:hypothetical protein
VDRGLGQARPLLGDILDASLDRRAELEAVRAWVRHALRYAKLRDALSDNERHALLVRPLASAKRVSRIKHTRTLTRGAIHLDD